MIKAKSLNEKLWTELTIEEVEERIERMLIPHCIGVDNMMCGGCFGIFRVPNPPNPRCPVSGVHSK
ncbi:MAG: hypothetical protein DDT40_00413 [candidate division WS2 bacterium]|uniref:Uncharacterized protein n=1 Tax=Psychracetigena formicireducens TaxID=2986056 RepID=A0A9E2F6W9_PSYF1|nr:hypothetical protein [Candidatus Psychracetigena formicireducens]MBT9145003.1 hypothetical protein [Candidatus Psychracetigena formicireducens]MBT9150245.1 hypothetical protein [Candidatus Psychracetigena formicireducens]